MGNSPSPAWTFFREQLLQRHTAVGLINSKCILYGFDEVIEGVSGRHGEDKAIRGDKMRLIWVKL
jgi:hypothetical protein